jgi:sodium/potassium/calcium exchanger 6
MNPPSAAMGLQASLKLRGRFRGVGAVAVLVLVAVSRQAYPQNPTSPRRLNEPNSTANTTGKYDGVCAVHDFSKRTATCYYVAAQLGHGDESLPCEKTASCCSIDSHFMQYLHVYYCDLPDSLLGMMMLLGLLTLCFMLLGSTAEDFFCPALASLSEILGLQPRVAGVTLLALGNGAPDVFSIISSVKAKQASMAGKRLSRGPVVSKHYTGKCTK